MASLSEMFNVANATLQQRKSANPLTHLAAGLERGFLEAQAKREAAAKRQELFEMLGLGDNAQQVNNNATKQEGLVKNPRSDFKIERSVDLVTGRPRVIARDKTEDEKFNEAAQMFSQGLIDENDLRETFPTQQDIIDNMILKGGGSTGAGGGGIVMSKTPNVSGRIIKSGTGVSDVDLSNPQPGDFIPEKLDAFGRPVDGFKLVKKSAAQDKRDVENKELGGASENMLKMFINARKEAEKIPNFGDPGIMGRVAGIHALIDGKLGNAPAVSAFHASVKAFGTLQAKAGGEQRPTDEDVRRFIAAMMGMGRNDKENAIFMDKYIADLESKKVGTTWAKEAFKEFSDITGVSIDSGISKQSREGSNSGQTASGLKYTIEQITMAKITFETGQVVNFDGDPTPQDIEEVAKSLNIQAPEQNEGLNTLGKKILPTFITGAEPLPGERTVLGDIFERPGAAVRSGIRSGIDSAMKGEGFEFDKGFQEGAINPENVELFQNEFIDRSVDFFGGPTTSFWGNAVKGVPGSVVGLFTDIATNPADSLMALLSGGASKVITTGSKAVKAGSKLKSVGKLTNKPIAKTFLKSTKGRRTAPQISKFKEKAALAVDTITDNKKNLKYTDDLGDVVQGKLPEDLDQLSQAIDTTKRDMYKGYNALQKQAGKGDITLSLDDIAKEIKTAVNKPHIQDFSPEIADYARLKAGILEQRKFYSLDEAQEAVQHLNSQLKTFYKNPNPNDAGKRMVDQVISNHLRRKLDSVITESTGKSYQNFRNRYGALIEIEDDVNKAAVRIAGKNPFGLLDFTDVFTGGQIAEGIITTNTGKIARGGVGMALKTIGKFANNPNRRIKNLFKNVDRLKNGSILRQIPKKVTAPIITRLNNKTSNVSDRKVIKK